LLLLGIGVAALLAAVPFLRSGGDAVSTPTPAVKPAEGEITLDAPPVAGAVRMDVAVGPLPVPAPRVGVPAVVQVEQPKPAAASQFPADSDEASSAPPLLASTFPAPTAPFVSPPEDKAAPAAVVSSESASLLAVPNGAPPAPLQPVPVKPVPEQPVPERLVTALPAASQPVVLQRHTIRDGDTLERLAERYLGDAAHADAIFEANRATLSQRDLLPIGVEIVIPAVGQGTSAAR
jgi:nucleoid-associated protein YgaU